MRILLGSAVSPLFDGVPSVGGPYLVRTAEMSETVGRICLLEGGSASESTAIWAGCWLAVLVLWEKAVGVKEAHHFKKYDFSQK